MAESMEKASELGKSRSGKPKTGEAMNAPSAVKQTKGKRVVGDGTPGPGRKKGVPNKMTVEVKEMIRQALAEAGGVDYLVERAKDPRTASAFLSLVGKVLPLTVHGDPNAPIQLILNGSDVHG